MSQRLASERPLSLNPIQRATDALHRRLIFGRRVRVLARHIASLIPPDARSVIDLGCGDGSLAHLMLEHRPDLELRGLEIKARPMTAIAVTEFDGITMPFADRSHDVVMMVDMLHHAENAPHLLAEAARVAKRAVIVKDHLLDPWLGGVRLRAMDWAGNVAHGVALRNAYWTRDEWRHVLDSAGLIEAERREQLGLYTMPLRWLFETGLHFVSRFDVRANDR